MACGEIAGLRDPGATEGDPDGGLITDPAGTDDVVIQPSSIDVGAVACGTASANVQNIVIENRGATTPRYSVKVPDGSGFELQGQLEGDLGKGAKVTIGVIAKPSVPGEISGEVVLSAGSVVSPVAVKAVGEGAKLEIAPSTANIGAVRRQNGGALDVAVTNTGNKPATLTKIDSSLPDFSATWDGAPAPLVIGPAETKTLRATLKEGAESAPLTGTLTFAVDGAVCGTAPVLPIEGQRVNQDVTIQPADFGNQFCTTTPALQRDVVISNFTSETLAYNATLAKGAASLFNVVSGAMDTIPPGTTATPSTKAVKLSMKQVPGTLGAMSEALNIEVSGIAPPSGGPRTATISANVRGIVLTITPSNMTGFSNNERRNVTFANSGNENWSFGAAFVREPGTTQQPAWSYGFGSVGAGTNRVSSVTFDPSYYGYYAGSWTFTSPTGVPFCNGTPKLRVQGAVF